MCNTLVDVVLYTILRKLQVPPVLANILSTSVALLLSLLLNYRYTFRDKQLGVTKVVGYIVVTLTGLWVLQPLIINSITDLNEQTRVIENMFDGLGSVDLVIIIIPKILSIGVTLVWNYIWYSRVIFKKAET